jgi:hypothetical protein
VLLILAGEDAIGDMRCRWAVGTALEGADPRAETRITATAAGTTAALIRALASAGLAADDANDYQQ